MNGERGSRWVTRPGNSAPGTTGMIFWLAERDRAMRRIRKIVLAFGGPLNAPEFDTGVLGSDCIWWGNLQLREKWAARCVWAFFFFHIRGNA